MLSIKFIKLLSLLQSTVPVGKKGLVLWVRQLLLLKVLAWPMVQNVSYACEGLRVYKWQHHNWKGARECKRLKS